MAKIDASDIDVKKWVHIQTYIVYKQTVWICTQILTLALNRHIDYLFSDSDKHFTKNTTLRMGYDYLQANQQSI